MASRLAEIKAVLLTSGVQQTNQPLWQAINQLLDYLIAAEKKAATSGAGSGSTAVASQILQLLFQELGQQDDWILIPGPRGFEGIQGLLGPPGFDGEDGQDSFIPGPKGEKGDTGVSVLAAFEEAESEPHLPAIPSGFEGGKWESVTFNAGDFTASGGATWTVAAGDVNSFAYTRIGNTLGVLCWVNTTDITVATPNDLQVLIPAGYTCKRTTPGTGWGTDNGTPTTLNVRIAASGTQILISKTDATAWALSAANTQVRFVIWFEI